MSPGRPSMRLKNVETYHWATLVSQINTRGRTRCPPYHHTSHQLWERYIPALLGIRAQTHSFTSRGSLSPYWLGWHAIEFTDQIESGFIAVDDLIPFGCSPLPS
ncbi:hypothetical protein TNCV_2191211 [Trichonephila clavipes]|nr:hypothetical protein TNCV_2191211 [Trichonephila clavipes]